MFVLGLLFLAAAGVAAVELVLANDTEVTFSMWNQDWRIESYWLAAIGAAILFAAVIGLWLLQMSTTRQRRIRRERKELAAENRRLAERVQTPAAGTTTARDGVPANRAGAAYPPAATGDYPAAPAAPATGTMPAGEPVEEEHRGFFGRHALSGRRHS